MCGIAGAMLLGNGLSVGEYLYLLALSLQHRGKEGAGMAWQVGEMIRRKARLGEVAKALAFNLKAVFGRVGIVQNRYGTAGKKGKSGKSNMQPMGFMFLGRQGQLVHNGNLVNVSTLKAKCKRRRWPKGCSDTFVISVLLSESPCKTMEEALVWLAEQLQGGFNLIVLYEGTLYAIKDRHGFHPFQIGRCDENVFLASESCAFGPLEAELMRDIMPGELVIIDQKGDVKSYYWTENVKLYFNTFDFIYFARPDSVLHGVEVGRARQIMGRKLAQRYPLDVDLVISVPDSGKEAALGYYMELQRTRFLQYQELVQNDPFAGLQVAQPGFFPDYQPEALFRPHIVSRTFTEPVKEYREKALRLKFSSRYSLLDGKRVAVIDDSMVRGTTSRKVMRMLWAAGAKEVHLLLASPPYAYPELYGGADTAREGEELIYYEMEGDLQKIAMRVNATTVNYPTVEDTVNSILEAAQGETPFTPKSFHVGPFTGENVAGVGDYASLKYFQKAV